MVESMENKGLNHPYMNKAFTHKVVGFALDVSLCLSVTSVVPQGYLLNGVVELKKKVGSYSLFLL
jgi:hypothetical protein